MDTALRSKQCAPLVSELMKRLAVSPAEPATTSSSAQNVSLLNSVVLYYGAQVF